MNLIDPKDLFTNIVGGLAVLFLGWLISKLYHPLPKVRIQFNIQEHQVGRSGIPIAGDYITQAYAGKSNYRISYSVCIILENMGKGDAIDPQISFSALEQIDVESLEVMRIKAGEKLEIKGHYYYTKIGDTHQKPPFVVSAELKDIGILLTYRNWIGSRQSSYYHKGKTRYDYFQVPKKLKI